jgi:protein TonB
MNLRQVALMIGFALLMATGAYGVYVYLSHPVKSAKPKAQQIAVLRQQPPPPPPKPQEKPPEPDMKKEEVKLPDPDPEPKQADDQPPPAENLGVDAAGGAGSDGFGLQGRPGGRDITTIGPTGNGTGASRAQFAMYSTMVEQTVQAHLQRVLSEKDALLRQPDQRVTVRLWFSPDGRMTRAELSGSTGSEDVDAAIRTALADMPRLRTPLPSDMPQPVKARIVSRAQG